MLAPPAPPCPPLQWSTGLFDCCNGSSLMLTLLCVFLGPCIPYGMLTQKNGSGFMCGCLLVSTDGPVDKPGGLKLR